MSKTKKNILLAGILLLSSTSMASTFVDGVVLPPRVMAMDAMDLYPLILAAGLLGMTLVLPLMGRLRQIFGVKTVTIFGLLFQLLTRTILIFTHDPTLFIVMYTLTAVGISIYIAMPFVMIAEVVEQEERPKYYGMLITFQAAGGFISPLIAGALMEMGFRGLGFIGYLPFFLLSAPIIFFLYPKSEPSQTTGVKFDFAGILLLVATLTCIIFYLSLGGLFFGLLSPAGIALLIAGLICLFFLVRVESKHPNPSVPIFMFKKKRFRTAFLSAITVTAFANTMSAYVIVFAQQVMQESYAISSTINLPINFARAVFGIISGRILAKNFYGRFRPMALISLLLVFFATLLLNTLHADSSMLVIYAAGILGGVGSVVPQSNYVAFFQTELVPEEFTMAQGMFTFAGPGGASIYVALSGTVLNLGGNLNHTFVLASIFCGVSLLIGIFGLRLPKEV